MAGTRLTNTMEEGLSKLLRTITDMKVSQDADLEWLIGLETQVIEKIRAPFEQQMSGGMDPMGGQMADPMMADPMFPPMPGAGGPPPPGVMGGMNGMVDPISQNPDELRRLMS